MPGEMPPVQGDAVADTFSERGFIANTGEVFAWLESDPQSAESFARWYNAIAAGLGVNKPLLDWRMVARHAGHMAEECSRRLREMT